MAETNYSINLIRSQEPNFIEKFLKWALTAGRFLVILTETVALAMFLYRFNIDSQLIDLHDLIKNKQNIVAQLAGEEKDFRNLQDRLALAKALQNDPQSISRIYTDIFNLEGQNVTISSLLLTDKTVSIDASTNSRSALQDFINGVKTNPLIGSVTLGRIENKASTATIKFSLVGDLKISENSYEK